MVNEFDAKGLEVESEMVDAAHQLDDDFGNLACNERRKWEKRKGNTARRGRTKPLIQRLHPTRPAMERCRNPALSRGPLLLAMGRIR